MATTTTATAPAHGPAVPVTVYPPALANGLNGRLAPNCAAAVGATHKRLNGAVASPLGAN